MLFLYNICIANALKFLSCIVSQDQTEHVTLVICVVEGVTLHVQ